MTSTNTNLNPSFEQNYVPPGQSNVLTNTPDTQTVQPGAGGGGAMQVIPRDLLIQNVPPGVQNTTNSNQTTPEITPNAPLLIPGTFIEGDVTLGFNPASFLQQTTSAFFGLFGIPHPTSEDTTAPTLPPLPGFTESETPQTIDNTTIDTPQTQSTTTTDQVSQTAPLSPSSAKLTDEQIAELENLHSCSTQTVFQQLCAFAGVDPSADTPTTKQLYTIANELSLKNAAGGPDGFNAVDAETILSSLQGLYSGNDPNILQALTTIAQKIVPINVNAAADLNSTDANVILRVLQAQVDKTGGDPPASQHTQIVVANALVLLAKALALLSELRASMSGMETKLSQRENQTKLAQLKEMTVLAMQNYEKGLDKIQKNAKKMHHMYAMQRLMKILGPIIAVFIAIITTVITVFSGGAGSALGVGLIAATVALSSLSIADSAGGVLDKLCDALHIKNDVLRGLFKMAVMITLVILSGGTATAGAVFNMTSKSAMTAATALTANVTKAVVVGTIGLAINCVFSSGFLTASFKAMLQAAGVPEEKAAIGAMVITIALMIAALAATIGVLLKGGATAVVGQGMKTAGQETGSIAGTTGDITLEQTQNVAQQGEIALEEVGEQGAQAGVGQAIGEGVQVGTAIADVGEQAATQSSLMKNMMNLARNMKEAFKDPVAYVRFLNLVSGMIQIASNVTRAKAEFTIGKLSLQQASLEEDISQLQAMLGYLQALLPSFDVETQKIGDSMKQFAKSVSEMVEFYAQFIDNLSQATTNAMNKGV